MDALRGGKMYEKLFVEINGSKQGMFLQSENDGNPVLLYLHGGPGAPEIAFSEKHPTGLETLFTVCWWEQRGSGLSYNHKITSKEMTLEQMVSDTIAVANYLRERFNKDKIYIMGHSWGSLLGVLTIKQQPEIFQAYVGIGQVAQGEKSERLAYTYMLEKYTELKNHKMVRKLKKYPIDKGGDISIKYLINARSEGMNRLGIGVMRTMSTMREFASIVVGYKGYSLREKFKYIQGSSFSLKNLCAYMMKTDLIKQVPSIQVPVYIFQGKYDYQASYVVAKDFALALKAPMKGFYTFENSAHSPCYEEPDKMCTILRMDILKNQVSLADKIEYCND
jgi:pimeloyl-ACP methyl ester carboxylesterase